MQQAKEGAVGEGQAGPPAGENTLPQGAARFALVIMPH